MRCRTIHALAGWCVLVAMSGSIAAQSPHDHIGVAPFQCEVTPPIGHWLYANPTKTIEHPLLAKGVVLEQDGHRMVVCAIDWCVLSGLAHTRLRQQLADGAETKLDSAVIQCVHVHTAPVIDIGAKRLLEKVASPPEYYDPAFLDQVADRLKSAVQNACTHFVLCDQIGRSQAKVERVASNRRIMVDGKIIWRSSSRGNNQRLADLPEGTIDPYLKTVSFAKGNQPVARLHYYATHPQSYYRDGRASYDFVGMAREDLQKEEGVFQIYFTGCSGDVAAGKYNDGTPDSRRRLHERLLAAMRTSASASRYQPVSPIILRTAELSLPLKDVPGYNADSFRQELLDPLTPKSRRIWAARRLAFFQRTAPISISSLQIGDIFLVHLPGEPMLEFQRFAQRAAPDAFVAVAGYGDGCTSYICTDNAFEEGAYEPGAAAVGPGSEAILKSAIRSLVGMNPESCRD